MEKKAGPGAGAEVSAVAKAGAGSGAGTTSGARAGMNAGSRAGAKSGAKSDASVGAKSGAKEKEDLFSGFREMFARLEGKPELTLEKTGELALLHWGTLGLYFIGCLAIAFTFSDPGFFPLLMLAAAGGFVYSWYRAGKLRRKEDVFLGLVIAFVLAINYTMSLGRYYTAASVATIVASSVALAGVMWSFTLKKARDYRIVQCVAGAMALLSTLSFKAASLVFISLYLVLLLPVALHSHLEHLHRRKKKGSLTQARQGKRAGVFASYILPVLVALAAAALLYQVMPKPLREQSGKVTTVKSTGGNKSAEGSGSESDSGGSGSSGSGSGSGSESDSSGSGNSGSGSGSGNSGSSGSGDGLGNQSGSGSGSSSSSNSGSSNSGNSGSGSGSGSNSGNSGNGSGSGSGSASGGTGSSVSQDSGGGSNGSAGAGSSSKQNDEHPMVRNEKPQMDEEESRNVNRTIYILLLAVVLALLAAAGVYYIRKWLAGRKKDKEPEQAEMARRAAFNEKKPGDFVCLTYAAMCGELSRLGYSRESSETPTEYLWRLNERVPSVEKEAGVITQALTDVLYAGQVPESGLLTQLDALLKQVRGKVAARLAAEAVAGNVPPPSTPGNIPPLSTPGRP